MSSIGITGMQGRRGCSECDKFKEPKLSLTCSNRQMLMDLKKIKECWCHPFLLLIWDEFKIGKMEIK